MYQELMIRFGGEVHNNKIKQFHIGKYERKRTHDVIEDTVNPHFLLTLKGLPQVQLVIIQQSNLKK